MKMLLVGWFSTTGTFAAILAIHYWRQAGSANWPGSAARPTCSTCAWRSKQQRMLALRAQFEPHFLFNALNAISALVRDGDRRWPSAASAPERPAALCAVGQRAQYGHRRHRAAVRARLPRPAAPALWRPPAGAHRRRRQLLHEVECPPLLLQPLIENALRHDLDCREGPSDIRLASNAGRRGPAIRVTNPVSAHASPNPGAGLGLANTRERLKLMHPGASLPPACRTALRGRSAPAAGQD
jgi:two-component system sensor histidine kinase AlgZ